jgi:H+/Cl- antiporter ClcA
LAAANRAKLKNKFRNRSKAYSGDILDGECIFREMCFVQTRNENDTVRVIKDAKYMQYALVVNGLLVGVAAGGIAVLYRIMLDRGEKILRWMLAAVQGNGLMIAGWFVGLVFVALLVARLVRWEPMISGSGIPQVSGEMKGYLHQNWVKVIVGKLVGGTACILGGLSLGREGPSVQLGAMVGKGISRLLHRVKTEEKYLMICGAGAGLAAAFNAPLAGVLFALEEIHKNFSAAALTSVMVAAVAADFVSKTVFGLDSVFHFSVGRVLPLDHYWLLLLLGVLIGICGAAYNASTMASQRAYKHLPQSFRMVIPFLLAGVLGLTMPLTLGGGHAMIEHLYEGNLLLSGVLLLLAVKFLFSLLSFGSGAPGGIFFPLLVIGAYIGGAFGLLAIRYCGVDPELLNNFIILAMAGYFTAIVRAPVTGIILIAEMTGSLSHLLSLAAVSIIAYVVAYLLKSEPIYESLLENILRNQGIEEPEDTGEKILTTAVVQHASAIIGKRVSELDLPYNCLLVAVRRGGRELLPRGDTVIMASDTLVALADTKDYAEIAAQLGELCV